MDEAATPSSALTRDDIVDAALRIVQVGGVANLTMRKLAAELGVAVTAIYWHVGNREALLQALVDAELATMQAIRPSGSTPHARIASVAHTLRKRLLAHRHVVELVHERGQISTLFAPAQVVLARELLAAGLSGSEAASATRALQLHVIGSVILQRFEERQPVAPDSDGRRPAKVAANPRSVAEAAEAISAERIFEHATNVLVAGLLGDG